MVNICRYNNELKLIDFGCAVQVDDKSTEKLGGTSEYMAPEVSYIPCFLHIMLSCKVQTLKRW